MDVFYTLIMKLMTMMETRGFTALKHLLPENSRTVADQAVSTGTSIVGGRLGSVANAVVRTGASLFRNASGESYVNLKSGYEFYIMKKQ